MSQPISMDIVSGSVYRYSVGVEACDCIPQKVAHRGVISKDRIEYIESGNCVLFEITNDSDLLTFAREDQYRWPRQVIRTNEKIQNRVAYAAGLTNEREP